jgi:hypothetical protein
MYETKDFLWSQQLQTWRRWETLGLYLTDWAIQNLYKIVEYTTNSYLSNKFIIIIIIIIIIIRKGWAS